MENMIKNIKFFIRIAGDPVRNLDDLKRNFLLQEVMELFRNGVLSRWLVANGYDDQSRTLNEIPLDAADDILARSLVDVFYPEYPQEALNDALHYFHFQREREAKRVTEKANQEEYGNLIKDYHDSFKELCTSISDKRADFDFLCRAAIDLVDNYWLLFQNNAKGYKQYFFKNAPCIFFPLMALGYFSTANNADVQLRDQINGHIIDALSCGSIEEIYARLSGLKQEDENGPENAPLVVSPHLHYVDRGTDSWDDLVQDSSRRIMVISLSLAGHVRSTRTRDDFGHDQIAKIFPIFSGIDYKDASSYPKLLYIDLPAVIKERCDESPLFALKNPTSMEGDQEDSA